jgi:hypothetical protein
MNMYQWLVTAKFKAMLNIRLEEKNLHMRITTVLNDPINNESTKISTTKNEEYFFCKRLVLLEHFFLVLLL